MDDSNTKLSETVFKNRGLGQIAAWFPVTLKIVPNEPWLRWYGHNGMTREDGQDLYGLALEIPEAGGKEDLARRTRSIAPDQTR